MIWSAWSSSKTTLPQGSYGLRVGNENRNKFSTTRNEYFLILDGEKHLVHISPGFWSKCPEIRDKAIKIWLEKQGKLTWKKGDPPKFNVSVDESDKTTFIVNN